MIGKRALTSSIVVLSVLTLASCSDEPLTPLDPPTLRNSMSSSLHRPTITTLDDAFAGLAEKVPGGFGGFFGSSDGRLTVYLVDPSKKQSALTALAATVTDPGVRRDIARGVRVLQGRYDYGQLTDWRGRLGSIVAQGGVTFTDIDEVQNKVSIGVERAADRSRVASAVGRLGIPAEAVVIQETGPATLETTLRDYNRPPRAGVQVERSGEGACTLGFNVLHYIYGRTFVTASHCTNGWGGLESTVMYQPDVLYGARVGVEVVDPPFVSGLHPTRCPPTTICRYSDAALIRYDENVDFGPGLPPYFGGWEYETQGVVARTTGLGSITIDPANPNLILGGIETCSMEPCNYHQITAHKIGRTTGWSAALISGTCVDVVIDNRVLICQFTAPYNSAGGDSGAPVFMVANDDSNLLFGVHSGSMGTGQRWFSKFSYIRSEIGYDEAANCYGFVATYWWSWQCI